MRMTAGAVALPVARPDLGDAEIDAVAAVMRSGWMGRGPLAERFESELADRVGAPHVVAVATGTAALQLALESLGIGRGDEVVVPSLTFCATYQAVSATGATPVFADVDERTLCLDPVDAEARIGPRTRAILPVHYCGYAGGREAVAVLADRRGLALVEDAAHAFGSLTGEGEHAAPVGSTGNAVCFSFDPIKSLTCGQGGAVATSDPEVAARLRRRSDLGLVRHADGISEVVDEGYRYALSDLNAAIGLAQLEHFDGRARRRRALVERYRHALDAVRGVTLLDHPVDSTVPFMFVVRVPAARRTGVRRDLEAAGIGTGVHYPPGHLQPRFRSAVSLPVTERVAGEILTLPLFPAMSDADVDHVTAEIARSLGDETP